MVRGESVEGPTSRVATKGTTVRHFISEPMPHLQLSHRARRDRRRSVLSLTVIGYARVSTTDQDLSIQESALKAAGCEVAARTAERVAPGPPFPPPAQ
jgi:hypothetical protein